MSEEKKIFDEKFVHFMWDESLIGKEGIFSDSIKRLVEGVEYSAFKLSCDGFGTDDYPFRSSDAAGTCWQFFYHDPLYNVKLAWKQGKTIQARIAGFKGDWVDLDKPNWGYVGHEYRIKPEDPTSRRMTYRELAEWLAKGNGQQSSTECSVRYTFQEVVEEEENKKSTC